MSLGLTLKEKKILGKLACSAYVQKLSEREQLKLQALLGAIAYAEKSYRLRGRWITRWVEKMVIRMGLEWRWCSTIGFLSVNVCHATRFGFNQKDFRKQLSKPLLCAHYAARHIVEDIGLDKAPEHIIAEYNHHPHGTLVAGLQRALNLLHVENNLAEDGIFGPQTKRALQNHIAFKVNDLNKSALDKIQQSIPIQPLIPSLRIKKWIIGFSVDVPAYVKAAMSVYFQN